MLSAAEFAAAIGKTERQVYRYIQKGRVQVLSPEETGLAGVRIPESELQRFLERVGPPSGGWVRPRVGLGNSFEGLEDSSEERTAVSLKDSTETDAVSNEDAASQGYLTVPLDRHEAAVMRLGYLQSQLEQSQRLLSDGSQHEQDMKEQLTVAQQAVENLQRELLKAEVRAQTENEHRCEAEGRARSLAVRLEEAERKAAKPWWQRIFG